MSFTTRNAKPVRFKLIDAGYKILNATMQTITWNGEIPPRSFGIELVAA
jgi:hypothetical protein